LGIASSHKITEQLMAKKKSKRQHKPKKTDKGPDVVDSEKDADANGSGRACKRTSLFADQLEN